MREAVGSVYPGASVGGDVRGTYGNDVELIVARPDGTHQRTLFTLQEPIHDYFEAVWSPRQPVDRVQHRPPGPSRPHARDRERRDPGSPPAAWRWGSRSQRPAWSPDSKRLAVALGGRTGTMTTAGGCIHSLLEVTGASLAWSPRDQITIAGPDAQPWKVFASRTGIAAAKLIFRLPSKVAVVAVDPQ